MLNNRALFTIGEVKLLGCYPCVWSRRSRWPAAFTFCARETDTLIRRAGYASGESQPADPSTIFLPGDVGVPQRFF